MFSNMNSVIEHLEFIKNIPRGRKLYVRNESLHVDPGGPFQRLRRFVTRDSRGNTLDFIKAIYTRVNQIIIETTVADSQPDTTIPDSYFSVESAMTSLRDSLAESTKGLNELKDTYIDDVKTVAQIQCILNTITRSVAQSTEWLGDNKFYPPRTEKNE